MLSKTGEIRRDESCLDYSGSDVVLYPCHGSKGNQQWIYNPQVMIPLKCFHVLSLSLSLYSICLSLIYTNQKQL